jgi:chromosome segregation ATPase
MQSMLFPIFCLLAGGIIAWIIRKLIFEKNYVAVADFIRVKDQLQELITQKAVVDSALVASRGEIERYVTDIQSRDSELKQLSSDFTKVDTEKGGLMLDINDKNVEIYNLNAKLEVSQTEALAASKKVAKLEAELTFKHKELEEGIRGKV